MDYLSEAAKSLFRREGNAYLLECIMNLTNSVDCGDMAGMPDTLKRYWLYQEINMLDKPTKLTLISDLAIQARKNIER